MCRNILKLFCFSKQKTESFNKEKLSTLNQLCSNETNCVQIGNMKCVKLDCVAKALKMSKDELIKECKRKNIEIIPYKYKNLSPKSDNHTTIFPLIESVRCEDDNSKEIKYAMCEDNLSQLK